MSAKGKYHDDVRGDGNAGTWDPHGWQHITVPDTSEASPLCISSPGVYNGLNHYIHYTPFTWKLHFGLSTVKNTNWVFIVKKKPHVGESAVMVGKCLHFFFFFRNNASWQFYLVFKTGSPGALAFTHVLEDVLCKPRAPPCQRTRYFPRYMLVSSSEPVWPPPQAWVTADSCFQHSSHH